MKHIFTLILFICISAVAHALPTHQIKVLNIKDVLKSTGTLEVAVKGPDFRTLHFAQAEADGTLIMPDTVPGPVHVEYSVSAQGGSGMYYIASNDFATAQEYAEYFSKDLYVYSFNSYSRPFSIEVSAPAGTKFDDWYAANIQANEELWAAIEFNPKQDRYAARALRVSKLGQASGSALFVFSTSQPALYSVTLYAGDFRGYSRRKIFSEQQFQVNASQFPSKISIQLESPIQTFAGKKRPRPTPKVPTPEQDYCYWHPTAARCQFDGELRCRSTPSDPSCAPDYCSFHMTDPACMP